MQHSHIQLTTNKGVVTHIRVLLHNSIQYPTLSTPYSLYTVVLCGCTGSLKLTDPELSGAWAHTCYICLGIIAYVRNIHNPLAWLMHIQGLLLRVWGVGLVGVVALCTWCSIAYCAEYSTESIVNAIYIAEGGAKTKHPYGILKKYKHTSPRQACINTVEHKYRDWIAMGRKGEFITYLASKYAPLGVANDPGNLNKNWERNVRFYLNKQQTKGI